MDGEIWALVGTVILHGSLLWYRMGKLEQKVANYCIEAVNGKKQEDKK